MTSPTPQAPRFDFRLRRPAALIAALPALLGFVPERSLVVVTLRQGLIDAVLRKDLDELCPSALAAVAELVCAGPADAAIAVVIGDEIVGDDTGRVDTASVIATLAGHLRRHGVSLVAGHTVDRVAADGWWRCYDGCGAGGPVDDPRCSPLATAAVVAGRAIYGRRDDLLALIEPMNPSRSAALAKSLRYSLKRPADAQARDRRDINRIMVVACQVGEGGVLANRDVIAIARALKILRVRDTVCALAVGAIADDAERLWLELGRVLPAPWRAEALVLLGFSAYARGDGPLAGMALEAALAADPGHRMGQMLMTALHAGMKPQEIRSLADTGFRVAQDLGISLPPKEIARRAC